MLVDITPKPAIAEDPITKMLSGKRGEGFPRRLAPGVWEFAHHNADHAIIEKTASTYQDRYPPPAPEGMDRDAAFRAFIEADRAARDAQYALFLEKYKIEVVGAFDDEWTPEEERLPPVASGITRQVGIPDEYGVCDDYTQILAQCPHIADADEPYFISVTEVRREHQSETGGWRYHKWGPYIGTQKPESEYLYDDKHIDRVFCYHIRRITKSADEVMAEAGYRLRDMAGGVLVVAGKGLEQERVGIFPTREMAYAECFQHNAAWAERTALEELAANGYTIDLKKTGFEVVVPDGDPLGPYDAMVVAIRHAYNHRRKAANENKKAEEAAHG